MSVNMLNMSDNKPTICRTECLVVHHVRYHVRYLTPKRHPENEIIKIRKIHFILLKVSFYVWMDTQRSLNFQLLGFPIQVKIGHLVQMELGFKKKPILEFSTKEARLNPCSYVNMVHNFRRKLTKLHFYMFAFGDYDFFASHFGHL